MEALRIFHAVASADRVLILKQLKAERAVELWEEVSKVQETEL